MKRSKNINGITLMALVITIIVLLILAGVTLNTLLDNNGIINRAKLASGENEKETATEMMNLKITRVQISKYLELQRMPTLKELADTFCEDDDFQYVQETSEVASLTKISSNNPTSIYTKLKAYPYEFEINSSLQLASIDGVQIAQVPVNNNDTIVSMTKAELFEIIEEKLSERTVQNTMSTTGHFTGEYYLNGKPIYAKTIYISSLPNATYTAYSHNIDHVDAIWCDVSKSYCVWANGYVAPIVYMGYTDNRASVQIHDINTTSFSINVFSTDRRSLQAYVTLNYTLTTDTATIE